MPSSQTSSEKWPESATAPGGSAGGRIRAAICLTCLVVAAGCGQDDTTTSGWAFDTSDQQDTVSGETDTASDDAGVRDASTRDVDQPDIPTPDPDASGSPDADASEDVDDPPRVMHCIERSDNPASPDFKRTDFNADGNPTEVLIRDGGARRSLTTYEYDDSARLIRETITDFEEPESPDNWTYRTREFDYEDGLLTREVIEQFSTPGGHRIEIREKTYRYDGRGRLLMISTDRHADGSVDDQQVFAWQRESNREIRREYFTANGQRRLFQEYIFHLDGRVDQYFTNNAAFGPPHVIDYFYDARKRIVRKDREYVDSVPEDFVEFSWTDHGGLGHVTHYDLYPSGVAEAQLQYDSDGQLQSMDVVRRFGDGEERWFEHRFEGRCEAAPTEIQTLLFQLDTFVER